MTFRRFADKLFTWMGVAIISLVCFFGTALHSTVGKMEQTQIEGRERIKALEESKIETHRRLERIEHKQDSMEEKIGLILQEVRKK